MHSKKQNQINVARYNARHPELVLKRVQIYQAKKYAFVNAAKAFPCVDCGVSYPPYVMDFDHRPGTIKKGAVSRLRNSYPMKTLAQEIGKCDLVCSNCHRIRTWKRGKKN